MLDPGSAGRNGRGVLPSASGGTQNGRMDRIMRKAREPETPPEKYSFGPAAAPGVRVLILGSMPGEESLRQQQYYAYRYNAFWPIMGELLHFDPALPYPERVRRLNQAGVALWDTLAACRRAGSLDGDIRDARPNDIPQLLRDYPTIRAIGCNGGASHHYLLRSFPELVQTVEIVQLPSTSPAAARLSREEKREIFAEFLKRHLDIPG